MFKNQPWKPKLSAQDFKSQILDADGDIVARGLSRTQACTLAASNELLAACKRLITGHDLNSPAIIGQAAAMARAAVNDAESYQQFSSPTEVTSVPNLNRKRGD